MCVCVCLCVCHWRSHFASCSWEDFRNVNVAAYEYIWKYTWKHMKIYDIWKYVKTYISDHISTSKECWFSDRPDVSQRAAGPSANVFCWDVQNRISNFIMRQPGQPVESISFRGQLGADAHAALTVPVLAAFASHEAQLTFVWALVWTEMQRCTLLGRRPGHKRRPRSVHSMSTAAAACGIKNGRAEE